MSKRQINGRLKHDDKHTIDFFIAYCIPLRYLSHVRKILISKFIRLFFARVLLSAFGIIFEFEIKCNLIPILRVSYSYKLKKSLLLNALHYTQTEWEFKVLLSNYRVNR